MVRIYKVTNCFGTPKRGNKVMPTRSGDGIFTVEREMSSTSTLDIASVERSQQKPTTDNMQARRHSLLWNLLVDIPVLLLVAAVAILLEFGMIPSHKAGFVCNDPALSFPHTGDTFSILLVAVITLFAPLAVIWSVEAVLHREDEYNMKQNRFFVSGKTTAVIYRDYIYGAIINFTLLEVIKCIVGSPRPTFFGLCEPDALRNCTGSQFISNYKCTSKVYSTYLQIDSSRSFPSAHTSLAFYCGLFVAWYLQRRAFSWHNRSLLAVPFLQALCLVYAASCSLTRFTDRRHHWWDVLVGAILGVITVLYTVLVLRKNFTQQAVVSTSDISSSDGNNHQSVRRLLSSEPHVVVP